MSLPLVLWQEAEDEPIDSRKYYERQQPGLGDELVDEVDRVFLLISANPKLHAVVHNDIRKAVVNRFPFCIYYIAEPTEIAIV